VKDTGTGAVAVGVAAAVSVAVAVAVDVRDVRGRREWSGEDAGRASPFRPASDASP
jgi:hypothetical protein